MNATDPNVGPLTALATAFLSALMVVLDAFNVFHITAVQQGDVLALAGTSLAVGLYVFAFLHQKTALTIPTLPPVVTWNYPPAPAVPEPVVPPVVTAPLPINTIPVPQPSWNYTPAPAVPEPVVPPVPAPAVPPVPPVAP